MARVKWWKKFFPDDAAATPGDGSMPPWIRQVAMLTGILAGFAGYLTVRSSELSNEAIYHSNQAVLKQAQASDAWAEYQAESIKAQIADSLMLLPNSSAATQPLADLDKKFRDKQVEPKASAEGFEKDREKELQGGFTRLEEKDLLGYSGMAVQLAIALASVAALTRRRGVFNISIVLGAVGIAITGYAFWYHYHAVMK